MSPHALPRHSAGTDVFHARPLHWYTWSGFAVTSVMQSSGTGAGNPPALPPEPPLVDPALPPLLVPAVPPLELPAAPPVPPVDVLAGSSSSEPQPQRHTSPSSNAARIPEA